MEILLSVNNSSYLIEITSLILFFLPPMAHFYSYYLVFSTELSPTVFNYRDAHIDFSLDFNSQLKNYSFSPAKLYSVASLSSLKKLCELKIQKDKTHKQNCSVI